MTTECVFHDGIPGAGGYARAWINGRSRRQSPALSETRYGHTYMIDGGLRQILQQNMRNVHFQSIETGGTGRGIPDLNGCLNGVESWIELKSTDAWNVVIRPEQVGWAEKRIRHGGRVFLATRRRHDGGPRKGPAVDELWIHRGSDIRHVSRLGLQEGPPPLIKSGGGPSRWLWPVIEEILFSES